MSFRTAASPHTVDATVERLRTAVQARGATVFAHIDHAAAARAAGLELRDEQVLVFGDPRGGTLLMQDDALVGYELPLRVLVWSGEDGTSVAYREPAELSERYAVDGHAEVLGRMAGLLEQLVAEAVAET